MSGFLSAAWLLGLFAAAPALRTSERYRFPDRLRDALILGVAIPFTLGFAHALYPIACWFALVACAGIAYFRHFAEKPARSENSASHVPYILIGALVAVAWPQLMRPVLDGDSLSYHLPNAAGWVQAHSLWSTATRYWWYPPASELFAAALYAVGGPFALPWCGVGALALLGFRIVAWAREMSSSPLLGDALAAATVTAYPLAIQGGTLQNDVWLAAFFLECLWTMRLRVRDAPRALAITALIKPQGWVFALIALAAGRAPRHLWLVTGAALALWIVHDAILWNGALVAPASTMYGGIFASTIVAHGAPALATLVRVAFDASPFALLALLAALAGPALARRMPGLGRAACAAGLVFFVLPFGYATSVAQLATGASLRFAAPAIVAGAALLPGRLRRSTWIATALLSISTLYGVWYVLAIFWNDGGTHVAIACALLAVAVAAAASLGRIGWPNALAFSLAVIAAVHLAARHPLDYYTDALRVGNAPPGVYRWIAATRPAAIGGWGLRLGVVNVLSPATRTLDLADAGACEQARHDRVLLAAVAQGDLSPDANAMRLGLARACGRTIYDDASAIVTQP